jgi:CheY-like chemotaxis protein
MLTPGGWAVRFRETRTGFQGKPRFDKTGALGDDARMSCDPRPVLVIDDDALIAELLAVVLGEAGYQVMVANDGAEGLHLAQTTELSLIFCDMCMPGLSGVEVLRGFKATPATANVPFIFMSGNRMATVDGLQPDAFMDKPFTPEKVLQVLGPFQRRELAA